MKKYLLVVLAVLVIGVGGYFVLRSVGSGAGLVANTPTPSLPPGLLEKPAPTPIPRPREVVVTASEFSFSPSVIKVKVGERIKLVLKNDGQASHNLVIAGGTPDISTAISDFGETRIISPGEMATLSFTAPSSGDYNFFCSLPGHEASGLKGIIKAE